MTASTSRTVDHMTIGATASHRATVSSETIAAYAAMTGDHNPIHEDAEYAERTRFGRPVAHGLLVGSFIQTALTKLVAPGGVSTSYQLDLLVPTFVGTTIIASATCTHLDLVSRRATFTTTVVDDETRTKLISGTAVVAFPKGEHR
ncbi:MAG: MaoC domain protein [Mycobacterium sp.]|jgi:3-hydroxybutyryl-CoA dehydratase|nr:MaoC domain protein [Mycobacterium sp.]